LLKEVNSYSEFLCLTSAKKEELRTTSSPTASNSPDFKKFGFQRNERSTHFHVVFLMYAVIKDTRDLLIIPSLDLDIPIKKKDQSDIVIFKREYDQEDQQAEDVRNGPGVVVHKLGVPILVVEVKIGIPVDYSKVTPHHYIELFIYCLYIMKIHKTDMILGTLTDGSTWHTFKFLLCGGELQLEMYTSFASQDHHVVMGSIAQLLTLI